MTFYLIMELKRFRVGITQSRPDLKFMEKKASVGDLDNQEEKSKQFWLHSAAELGREREVLTMFLSSWQVRIWTSSGAQMSFWLIITLETILG